MIVSVWRKCLVQVSSVSVSCKCIGTVLVGLGAISGQACRTGCFLIGPGVDLWCHRVPFGEPKRFKINAKSRCNFKRENVASWKRLWVILGRFGSRLDIKHVGFSIVP